MSSMRRQCISTTAMCASLLAALPACTTHRGTDAIAHTLAPASLAPGRNVLKSDSHSRRDSRDVVPVSHEQAPGENPPAHREPVAPLAPEVEAGAADASSPLEPSPPRRLTDTEMSLAGLEALALANNPTLRQVDALVEQARGVWWQAGRYPNPVVGYEADEIGDDDTAGQQGGFISQTIVTADKLDWNLAVAARDVDKACWLAEVQRLRILTDVRSAYFEAVGAQRIARRTQVLLDLAERAVDASQQALDIGQIPESDKLLTEVQRNEVAVLLANARQQEQAARRRLAALAAIDAVPRDALLDVLDDPPSALDWQQQVDRLVAAHPLLSIARINVERARARLGREQAQPVPDVDLRLGSNHDFASHFTLFSAEIGVALPIHNTNRGAVAAASADLRQAADEVLRLELLLRQELADAFRRYEQAQAQAELFRESRDKAELARKFTFEAQQAGQFDIFRLLFVQRTWFDVEVQYINALVDLQQAAAEIDGMLLSGGLNNPGNLGFGVSQGLGGPTPPSGALNSTANMP